MSWVHTPFFAEVLPQKDRDLTIAFPQLRACGTLREAIDAAYGPLHPHLPLATATFTNFAVDEALGEHGAIVVAEKVVRVSDSNRPPLQRVDFFCYHPGNSGDVVRHHPGKSAAQNMKPHCMSPGTLCFHRDVAACHGVGQALHAQPPGMVSASTPPGAGQPRGNFPRPLLAWRAAMDQLCMYDVNNVNWKAVCAVLIDLPPLADHTVDWSDGSHFPWWVWMANTGVLRDIVNDGVYCVELLSLPKCVVVHSVRGVFYLSVHQKTGRMVIEPTPEKYDP